MVLRTFSGSPLPDGDSKIPSRKGWPLWLPYKIELGPLGVKMTPKEEENVKVLLTLLSSLRSIILTPEPDYTPLTQEYGGLLRSISRAEILPILKELGIKKASPDTTH